MEKQLRKDSVELMEREVGRTQTPYFEENMVDSSQIPFFKGVYGKLVMGVVKNLDKS